MRINENELVSELISIISDNVSDVKEQKEIYYNLIDLFMESFAVDSLAGVLGDNNLFDKIYEEYVADRETEVDEEFEYDE